MLTWIYVLKIHNNISILVIILSHAIPISMINGGYFIVIFVGF